VNNTRLVSFWPPFSTSFNFVGSDPMAVEGEEPLPPEVVPPLLDPEAKAAFIEERDGIFNRLFEDCAPNLAKKASLDEREKGSLLEENHLTYGECDVIQMLEILNEVREHYGPLYKGQGIFLDLGSGAGKACIAAGLLHPFQKCVGIEQLGCLDTFAKAALLKYQEEAFPDGEVKPEIEFMKGDFVAEMEGRLKPIAPQVAVCLAVATCFGEAQLKAMGELANAMAEGAVFVSFTQMLPDFATNNHDGPWTLLLSKKTTMSWGDATYFIMKKVAPLVKMDDGDPAEGLAAVADPILGGS